MSGPLDGEAFQVFREGANVAHALRAYKRERRAPKDGCPRGSRPPGGESHAHHEPHRLRPPRNVDTTGSGRTVLEAVCDAQSARRHRC